MNFVYFTDRDLGKRFPEILKRGGLTVERHADHFAHDTPDEIWLETVGKNGWIALTHDHRIRYKPNERDAVTRHGVALLVIIGKAPFAELANAFVTTLPPGRAFPKSTQTAVHCQSLSTLASRDRAAQHGTGPDRTLVLVEHRS